MSYLLPHLHSGWAVDQAILSVRHMSSSRDLLYVRSLLPRPVPASNTLDPSISANPKGTHRIL